MEQQYIATTGAAFQRYAGQDPDTWDELVGWRVLHNTLGLGVVLSVDEHVHVRFDRDSRASRTFARDTFCNAALFPELRMPMTWRGKDFFLQGDEAPKKRKAARMEPWERPDREMAALRARFWAWGVEAPEEQQIIQPVLHKLSHNEVPTEEEIQILEQMGLCGTMADVHELKFRISKNGWELVFAGRWWREAGLPERALFITEAVVDNDPRLKAAVLTTRAAAYRDLNELSQAERNARKAITLDPEPRHPLNLLAAICYQSGRFDEGDTNFALAEEHGATAADREREIRDLWHSAEADQKKEVANHLAPHIRSGEWEIHPPLSEEILAEAD